ncbi:MAG: hypothetical protein A3H13_03290 [Candidatus Taylorbacteria bacterium RIFCSPLOWO2_12_FULL_48_11]|uniref:Uncharacterized protein n=1 Tax=Candidatus Taylorbacteria bacterium RIFCSPLOWO2_01_FULL_48_100 TaxID=1802322 RepID=A0A1G2NE15_9BACT|nr:MAG: hypothetical protein A2670_02425 [Candidatus Taylorbacteria bacterium RIFCSPHIGHO2_01_FULL_48_38]OHA34304.1 MAG: hypothetical protein A2938_02100 [Candidatus Taylorbacteria bacterium RIFCSPLOWO2_01_FULL_48_100]OHA44902.1 MAG: hypothetical protein A3H13_03290 [Candidatus Taylorbacteria bacterium RIFCSPLOWO2_12_FULL_48_11]
MPYASFSVPCIRDRAKVLAHKACGARAFGRDGLLLNAFGLPYVNSIANYKIKEKARPDILSWTRRDQTKSSI